MNSAVRIAHILPYDPNQPGGVQTHLLALDRQLRRLGHDSTIFAPARPLRVRLGETRADLALHPADLLRLRRLLEQPLDILHIQEPLLPLLGPLALLHPGKPPTVVTLHSAEQAAAQLYRRGAPLTRRLLARADAVVCATRVTLDTAAAGLPRPVAIIPPGIELSPFINVTAQPTEPPTILFVGRDDPRKGLPLLLGAIAQMPAQVRLTVAGPVRQDTLRHARAIGVFERVSFLGQVPHAELPRWLATASCAVFPALSGEALGLVLVEAMAAGVPVVASDIPGYRIASRDGAAAQLVPAGSAGALAGALTALLDDQPRRAALAARGRAAARRFDIRPAANQYLTLYRRLVRARSAHRLCV